MPSPVDEKIILEAALAVWCEEGFRNATTRKVAARAGVGEVTLFRRFGDKVSLFKAALAYESERFKANGIAYTGDLRGDLTSIVQAYSSMLERSAAIVFDFLIEAPRNELLQSIAPVPLAAINAVAGVVSQYQAEGRLRTGPPMMLVLGLISPVLMRRVLHRAQPLLSFTQSAGAAPTDRESADQFVDSFLNGWSVGRE